MMRTRRLAVAAIATVLVLVAFGVLTAGAQTADLRIDQAALQLWPEYDDPGVLVIFSGTFTGTTSFPQTISVPVPDGARNIQATYADDSGTLMNRQFEVKDGKLTYELPAPNFHIEYYFDRQPGGNNRNIQFSLAAPYQIDSLALTVQQPARATDFAMQPPAQTSEPRSDGLTYHFRTQTDVAAGQDVNLTISYAKTDTGLSAPQLAVTGTDAEASDPAQPGSSGSPSWLPWVLIGVGGVALAGLATYALLARRTASAPAPAQPGRSAAARPAQPPRAPVTTTKGGVFCTQCGKPLRPDDRFCAQCAAPRRSQ